VFIKRFVTRHDGTTAPSLRGEHGGVDEKSKARF
jgi:hypothetical protein